MCYCQYRIHGTVRVSGYQPRRAIHAAVFPTELGRAFITHSKAGGSGIHSPGEHQPTGFLQAQLFLELQGRHASDLFEGVIKGRFTHISARGQIGNAQRLGITILQGGNYLGDSVSLGIGGSEISHTRPQLTVERPVENFPAGEGARIGMSAGVSSSDGVAVADLFPRFTLGGLLGSVASDSSDLFSGPAEYQQAILVALEETESRLVFYDRIQQRVARLQLAEAQAFEATRLAHARYGGGFIDYFEVLEAEQALAVARESTVLSRTTAMLAMLDVYRALAGPPG